jgi:5-methylcytosine-specific restriction endonuclease McrA
MDESPATRLGFTRDLVIARSKGRCERCGGVGVELHHRRRRGIANEHTHCPCNAMWLCRPCHTGGRTSVHGSPLRSRNEGWIVSVNEPEPRAILVRTWRGMEEFTCDGTARRSEWHIGLS